MLPGAVYTGSSLSQVPFVMGGDGNASHCDGCSSEGSSIGSPRHRASLDDGASAHIAPSAYHYGCPLPVGPPGAIPIQFEIASLYEDLGRRRSQASKDNSVSAQRRRAQNRASQRAFRDRKEKHVKDVEARLHLVEAKYAELSRSYAALQADYAAAKKDLMKLRGRDDDDDEDGAVLPLVSGPRLAHSSVPLAVTAAVHPQAPLLEYSPYDEPSLGFEPVAIGGCGSHQFNDPLF